MKQMITAPKLHRGDTVAIISPSNSIDARLDDFKQARNRFEELTGLKTVVSPNATGRHFYSSGTRQQRVDDFHWALNNPDVKGILFSVGGNTAIELVAHLDYDAIAANPKVIAGISDASTLLNAITAKTGLVTFLGLEFLHYAKDKDMSYNVEAIQKAWFDGTIGAIQPNSNWQDFDDTPTSYSQWQTIKSGCTEATIVGGNFSSYAQLFNTEYSPHLDGAILALETYQFPKRKIMQSFEQLKLWGVLDKISGLLIGYCVGSDDPDKIGDDQSMKALILEATEGYDLPIMQIGEMGHKVENIQLPIGARAKLDASNLSFEILDTTVV